jgi:hypothetical protein
LAFAPTIAGGSTTGGGWVGNDLFAEGGAAAGLMAAGSAAGAGPASGTAAAGGDSFAGAACSCWARAVDEPTTNSAATTMRTDWARQGRVLIG